MHISKELVPVSIRLKTTIKIERARKIIRKAEKDLFQARVKSINSILGDNAKQRELSRSQLVSVTSTSTMDKCQQFIDKVSELRFLKVKERQINKKEENITWFTNRANSQAGSASAVPPWQVVLGQKALIPRQSAPLLKQPALTPREIVLFRQVVSRQIMLNPR